MMIHSYMKTFAEAARAAGIQRLKFYFEECTSRKISFYEGELENLDRAEGRQLYIEGEVDGFAGSVFIENFDEAQIESHILAIRESAESCKDTFVPYALTGLQQNHDTQFQFANLADVLENMCGAETTALSVDHRVMAGVQIYMSETGHKFILADENLNQATDVTADCSTGVHLVVKEGDQVQPGGSSRHFQGDAVPDLSALAGEAAQTAVSRLGAGSYPTGNFPAVLDCRVVGELLDAFMPAFFARNVHSRMSVLAGKLGERVAGDNISVLEDPNLPGGFSGRCFDDEGVPTQAKDIIRNGMLSSFLHNRQSAVRDGCAPGGNGFKPAFNERAATGYTNVYIPCGDRSREQLLEEMGNGLLITGVSGVFAGAKPNSGDFSLISNGYRVENGKQGQAVTQITMAGNFFELLNNVVAVGNDENWKCTRVGCIRTPSLLVGSLTISGKEDA